MTDTHKLVATGKTFLVKAERTTVISKQADFAPVLGQDDEDLILFRLTVQLLVNDRKHAAVLAAKVVEITQVIEAVHARDIQHRTSSFSTRAFRPG